MVELAKGIVYMSGPPLIDRHDCTYLGYEIPKKLEKKLSKMMDAELKRFYKKCKCESCTIRRGQAKQKQPI